MPTEPHEPERNTSASIQSHARLQPSLVAQLRALGVEEGQVVLVRAAAKALGPSIPKPVEVLLDALIETVGPDGTLVTLTHSPLFHRLQSRSGYAFTPADAPVTTGGLAAAMAARPGAYRSSHPTNSITALGPQAPSLLQSHGPGESSFEPISRLAAVGGHMILVGCVSSSPGFSTVHVAQHMLGLSSRSVFSGMLGAPYKAQDGRVRWFSRRDHPGCSAGFSRLYPAYRAQGMLREGIVGEAPSMGIPAAAALSVDLKTLRGDPCACSCERLACTDCALRSYAASRWLPWLMAKTGLAR